jgi:hypothetical protein
MIHCAVKLGHQREIKKEASTMTILFTCTQFHRILPFVQYWHFTNISYVSQEFSAYCLMVQISMNDLAALHEIVTSDEHRQALTDLQMPPH